MVFWGESRAFWLRRGLSCYAEMFVAGFVASGKGATALAAVGDRRDKVKDRFKRQVSCAIVSHYLDCRSMFLNGLKRRQAEEARHGKIRVAWSRETSTTCNISSYDTSKVSKCLLSVSHS